MNDRRINSFLQNILKCHLAFKQQGKEELAHDLLVLGSKMALTMQKLNTIYCPYCHKPYTDKPNKDHIKHTSECLTCDHIKSDLYWNDILENSDYQLQ
jgi:hypothetical protein